MCALQMCRKLRNLALDKVRHFRILNRTSLPRSSDSVVVVGFIARRHDDSTQLLNRVIDSNTFASGNLDMSLLVDDEESKEWFERRIINYFHDHGKGIFFLQFSSTHCPAIHAAGIRFFHRKARVQRPLGNAFHVLS
ncbi:hypothetical protein JHK82_018818 [Glycine max]|nr:hypothetical protein JHK85_019262 [Glycine max]KAG5037996.1 hypothetical protein JHK86_018836 [Glycine max]KAG5143123.1 hypothetical protein JHK82_018818 [Glycine max]